MGEPGPGGVCAPFCGDSGGVASDGAAEKSALVDDGESGDADVGVCGSVGACRGRPALASSRRLRTWGRGTGGEEEVRRSGARRGWFYFGSTQRAGVVSVGSRLKRGSGRTSFCDSGDESQLRKNSSSLSLDDGNLLTLFISLPGRVDGEGAAVSAPAGRCRGKRNAKSGGDSWASPGDGPPRVGAGARDGASGWVRRREG